MSESLVERQQRLTGIRSPGLYNDPVHIVRADDVWLWDAQGKKYLDCNSNVAHIGHCHPNVVAAIAKQAASLTTSGLYLNHDAMDYVEQLTGKCGHQISQIIMTSAWSQANDIALRMARAMTGKTGIIATDNAFHGSTTAVGQLSAQHAIAGGHSGHVRLVPAPDSVQPVGTKSDTQAEVFARNVGRAIVDLEDSGHGFAGFILSPVFAHEGLPGLPRDFLEPTIGIVRRARGLVLCDEHQSGFGRTGSHWWAHDMMGFSPDVVTVGNEMGNGYPVAAVLTRPDIMAEFHENQGNRSDFGYDPVAIAAARATISVIEKEGLIENAHIVGRYMVQKLEQLKHPLIADVRSVGLHLVMEFASDNGQPAAQFADGVVQRMRRDGVLAGLTGRQNNGLKLRPPLSFGLEHADHATDALERALKECPIG